MKQTLKIIDSCQEGNKSKMPRNHRQHHKNEVNPTIEIGSIELSFTEELTFFVQFFCYLIMLYWMSYLQSLYRFLRGQLGQLVTIANNHNNNRPLPPRPANRRRLRQVAPVAPAADPTADGAAIWRLSPISCSPSVSSCKTTTTTTAQSSTTLDLPSQQTTNPQPQQTAAVSPDESIFQSSTLVETFGLAFRLSHLF